MNFKQKILACVFVLTLVWSADAFSQGPPPPGGGNVDDVAVPINPSFLILGLTVGAIGGFLVLRKRKA